MTKAGIPALGRTSTIEDHLLIIHGGNRAC